MIKLGFFLYKIRNKTTKYIKNYLNFYYKQKMISFGNGSTFYGISDIKGLEKIRVGNNVKVGANCIIRGEGGLIIGDNVRIAKNLVLYTQNHNYNGDKLPYNKDNNYKNVIIESNVWIGINVTILPGTTIKEGVIIGAGTVVYGLVNKCEIVGASTINRIKYRDIKHYDSLKKINSFFYD